MYPDAEIRNLEMIRKEYRRTKEESFRTKRTKLVRYIFTILLLITLLSVSLLLLQNENNSTIAEIRRSIRDYELDNQIATTFFSNAKSFEKYLRVNAKSSGAEKILIDKYSTKKEAEDLSSKVDDSEKNEPLGFNDESKRSSLTKLNNLKDPWEPLSPSDHAVFLQFPKSGGTIIKNILSFCHRKVLASGDWTKDHTTDLNLAVVKRYGDSLVVNIDPSTPEGIQRANDMGFADKHLEDITVTPLLYEINDLFTPESKGRIFSMFRHPIERAVSMWGEDKTMTLEDYAKSPHVENNFYTRVLSNTFKGLLTDDHFEIAKYQLQKRVLVGLLDRLDESLDRFEKYFGWKYSYHPSKQEKCRQDYILKDANMDKMKTVSIPPVESDGYKLLVLQNQYDLELYDLVLKIFAAQSYLVAGEPVNYRHVGALCSSCAEKS